jgi:2-iminoacetate synthase ThiH
MHMQYHDLVGLIRRAGRRPVERDSLYDVVRETFEDVALPSGADAGMVEVG